MLPSVCPNTSLPLLVGCHLKRQMSDRKEWASLCTVSPESRPAYTQIYNGPRWETNATPSAEFQHQLTDVGTPGKARGDDINFTDGRSVQQSDCKHYTVHLSTFSVVQSCYGLLFRNVPHDEQVISRGWRKEVRVVRAPADSCYSLLVFWHDGSQLIFIVLLIQLQQTHWDNDKEWKQGK